MLEGSGGTGAVRTPGRLWGTEDLREDGGCWGALGGPEQRGLESRRMLEGSRGARGPEQRVPERLGTRGEVLGWGGR